MVFTLLGAGLIIHDLLLVSPPASLSYYVAFRLFCWVSLTHTGCPRLVPGGRSLLGRPRDSGRLRATPLPLRSARATPGDAAPSPSARVAAAVPPTPGGPPSGRAVTRAVPAAPSASSAASPTAPGGAGEVINYFSNYAPPRPPLADVDDVVDEVLTTQCDGRGDATSTTDGVDRDGLAVAAGAVSMTTAIIIDVAALAATMMTSLLDLFDRRLSASLRGSGRRSRASQSAPDDELGTDFAGSGAAGPGAAGGGMCAPSATGSGHSWMPNGKALRPTARE